MKTFLFAVLLISSSFLFGQNKEVLIVQHMGAGLSSVNIQIFSNGELIEETPPVKDKLQESNKLLSSTFTKLYEEGWSLVAMSVESSYTAKYIFEREKP